MADPNPSDASNSLSGKTVEVPRAVIHTKKSSHHRKETHGTSDDIDETTSIEEVKGPNVFERVKEEFEAIAEAIHPKKDSNTRAKEVSHTKETHGTSDDIDEKTPIEEVKGPNVFERMKEEVEAIVQAIHPKKDSTDHK
ncbi:hypothetical protein Dimus_004145 [Dionaea muscipula]